MPKNQPNSPSSGTAAGTPADSPVQACHYELTTIVWLDTTEYCGNNARLEATITETPPDQDATVEVLHPSSGATLQTINARVTGGRVSATWVAKAATANWRTDQIRFRLTVSGIGITGVSTNAFTFRDRPTTDWTLIDNSSRCSHGSGHKSLYDIKLETNRVHLSVKMKAWGDSVPAATLTAFKSNAKTRIETVWNNGFSSKKFHRTNCLRGDACDCSFDCCKVTFRTDANFVDSGEHWRIKVIPQPDPSAPSISSWCRYNDSQWAYPPKAAASTYAHEFGHLTGQFDEYTSSCPDPAPAGTLYRQPQPPPASENNLMSHSGNTTLLNRHYRYMLEYLNNNSNSDPYKIIPAGP